MPQYDQWKTFIGVGVGSLFGVIMYRVLPKVFSWMDERYLFAGSTWLMVPVWLLTIDYVSASAVPPVGCFYAASVLCGIYVVVFSVSAETFLSKKITMAGPLYQSKAGYFIGVCFSVMSAGRFAGPLIIGAVTKLGTTSGSINCNNLFAVPPLISQSEACCITANTYYTDGCVLYRNQIYYPIMLGWSFVTAALTAWSLYLDGAY